MKKLFMFLLSASLIAGCSSAPTQSTEVKPEASGKRGTASSYDWIPVGFCVAMSKYFKQNPLEGYVFSARTCESPRNQVKAVLHTSAGTLIKATGRTAHFKNGDASGDVRYVDCSVVLYNDGSYEADPSFAIECINSSK